jgi:predicted nucleotidyltransferase
MCRPARLWRIFLVSESLSISELPLTKILEALRQAFSRILGDQLEAVLLFGSRARGEACPASDVDVLIVVRGEFDYGDLIKRTSSVVAALSLQYDVVISRVFVSKEQFERGQSPFLLNVRREGIAI